MANKTLSKPVAVTGNSHGKILDYAPWPVYVLYAFFSCGRGNIGFEKRRLPVCQGKFEKTNHLPVSDVHDQSDKFLLRSQLDCQDNRLPGTGTFDIKTRACLPIRLDILNFEVIILNDSFGRSSRLTGTFGLPDSDAIWTRRKFWEGILWPYSLSFSEIQVRFTTNGSGCALVTVIKVSKLESGIWMVYLSRTITRQECLVFNMSLSRKWKNVYMVAAVASEKKCLKSV